MRFFAVACITLLTVASLNAQEVDSLRSIIKSTAHDSIRAEAMADVAWLIKFTDSNEAVELARNAVEISRSINNRRVEAYAASNLGIVFWGLSKYDSAIHYLDISEKYYAEIGNERNRAVILINLALINQNIPDYTKSLDMAFQALRIFEVAKDTIGISSTYTNIGNVYYLTEEYSSALEYYKKSWNLRQMFSGKSFGETRHRVLLNIGNVFIKLEQLDSAIYYLNKSQSFAKEIPDYKNLALSNMDLAKVYSEQKEYGMALSYLRKSTSIYREGLINNPYDEAGLYLDLSVLFNQMVNYDSAYFYAQKSMSIANEIDNQALKKDALRNLGDVENKRGKYKEAYSNLFNSIEISDSLLNAEKSKQLSELQTQYETEKKEQQIALQEAQLGEQELKLERNRLLMVGLVLIAILFLAVIILNRNRAKKKEQLIKQEAQLKLREAELNAVINSQEKERNRFARDLHDGFGQLISVLKLNLSGLTDKDAQHPEKRLEVFKNGESVINDMYAELRSICFDLMPQTLVKKGITTALKEFGDRITQSKKVVCEVIVFSNKERLPEIVEISLFRICQEWVNNVMKYAEASHITIQLTRDETELTLTVEDDGKGFDAELFYSGKGNGWKNIQTRLNLIKGEFDLDTTQGRRGTMMTVNLLETDMKEVSVRAERSIVV